jgi:parallel beta-helix repeat protein
VVADKESKRRKEDMETKQKVRMFLCAMLVSFSMAANSEAATHRLTCGEQRTISDALGHLKPGDTLVVSGTCNENVQIPEQVVNVTLDGQGTTTLNASNANSSTILVRGTGITIRNFASITGGTSGLLVTRGGIATIDSNVIQNTMGSGIVLNQNGSARIVNNTIQENAEAGIVISETSSARIGFLATDDTDASPNVLRNNKENGIVVTGSSNARIVGNTIIGNAGHGVLVNRVSHADVSSNTIDSNGGDGVFVFRNSGVNLGEDIGSGIFDSPNITNANNGGFGIRCAINSYGDGRIGTLNGATGAVSFAGNCVNATSP